MKFFFLQIVFFRAEFGIEWPNSVLILNFRKQTFKFSPVVIFSFFSEMLRFVGASHHSCHKVEMASGHSKTVLKEKAEKVDLEKIAN